MTYVITRVVGEWSDRSESPIYTCESLEVAKNIVDKLDRLSTKRYNDQVLKYEADHDEEIPDDKPYYYIELVTHFSIDQDLTSIISEITEDFESNEGLDNDIID